MAVKISDEMLAELGRFAEGISERQDEENQEALDAIREKYSLDETPSILKSDTCGACGGCAICLGDGPFPDFEFTAAIFLVRMN